ncbi:MAG: hypothetical protein HBSAPP03_29360 [Phycisphaerae bacterium]|nr:MAG: hypothetical protein HBSAPP03_29360 [Phycisphaerae bacterium]
MSTTHDTPATLAEELDALLDEYAGRHERWLALAMAHREAIRTADGAGVAKAASAQGTLLEEIAGLESRRGALVNAAAGMLPGLRATRRGPITLRDVAAALPVAGAAGLLAKAERLRELVRRTNEETAGVAGATRAMLGHLEGLMRHVARQLSHAGTYSRRGVVDAGGAVVSALDLRT